MCDIDYRKEEAYLCDGHHWTSVRPLDYHQMFIFPGTKVGYDQRPRKHARYIKKHPDGWTISGRVHDEGYTWVLSFEARHPEYGQVNGDFNSRVWATDRDAFLHFVEHHTPEVFNYFDD